MNVTKHDLRNMISIQSQIYILKQIRNQTRQQFEIINKGVNK